jgi:hypothetical protein
MPWKSKDRDKWGSGEGDKREGESKGKDLPKKTHDRQKGRWKSAAHLGEHMGQMNDTGA